MLRGQQETLILDVNCDSLEVPDSVLFLCSFFAIAGGDSQQELYFSSPTNSTQRGYTRFRLVRHASNHLKLEAEYFEMVHLLVNNCYTTTSTAINAALLGKNSAFMSGKFIGHYNLQKIFDAKLFSGHTFCRSVVVCQDSVEKVRRDGKKRKRVVDETSSEDGLAQDENKLNSSDSSAEQKLTTNHSRGSVLQACIVTSGLMAAVGIALRQVSHIASVEGLPILDCTSKVSFGFETWHLELIAGLVVLISSSRYLLLEAWPDFAESSDAANKQVLTSLQPMDFIIVAFLPGISEELLFHGALLPLFGWNWKGVLVVAAIFGVLHLGGGRKYSFAFWATIVGIVYGYATVVSSSMVVPMASHALNNLVGGILWRFKFKSSE